MTYTVFNRYDSPPDVLRTRVFSAAKQKLFMFPIRADEVELGLYLEKHYGAGLVKLCYLLLLHITMSYNEADKELIIGFDSKKYDDLARLITYGTGRIPGSAILKTMFNSK